MKHQLQVNQHSIEIDTEDVGENRLTVQLDGKMLDVRYIVVSGNRILLSIGHGDTVKNLNAYLVDSGDGKQIIINGAPYRVQDLAAGRHVRKKSDSVLPETITPPMPAVVTAVLVKTGDEVAKGQGVIVISAMKIETTLSAPFPCRIREINVTVGAKVAPGDVLVDIEKLEKETTL